MSILSREEILPSVIHLTFSNQHALMRAFCRFQEHYESANPEFRLRPFTLSEYRTWYKKTYGGWTYYKDWSGTNVPSQIFDRFLRRSFNPLSRWEVDLLGELPPLGQRYYVIGTVHGDAKTLTHELAHGLYYTSPGYKKAVNRALKDYPLQKLRKRLLKMGYGENVIDDEVQAYVIADEVWLKANSLPVPPKLTKTLKGLFLKYYIKGKR